MRPQRLRIFVGCEGESEQGYVAFLHRLALTGTAHVHLDGQLLKGGDPLSRVEWIIANMKRLENRGTYASRFVLLDHDQVMHDATREQQTQQLADRHGLTLLWQRPTHEALLLRHYDAHRHLRPQTASDALRHLQQTWQAYVKGQTALQYGRELSREQVCAAGHGDDAFTALLTVAGLIAR